MAADFLISEKLWANEEPSERINRDRALKLDINMNQQPTTFYCGEKAIINRCHSLITEYLTNNRLTDDTEKKIFERTVFRMENKSETVEKHV